MKTPFEDRPIPSDPGQPPARKVRGNLDSFSGDPVLPCSFFPSKPGIYPLPVFFSVEEGLVSIPRPRPSKPEECAGPCFRAANREDASLWNEDEREGIPHLKR